MIETNSQDRDRLDDWAIGLLGLKRTSDARRLREQAIGYLCELSDSSNSSCSELDLPTIEALFWLIHQQTPNLFLVSTSPRSTTRNLPTNITELDRVPALQLALTAFIHAAPGDRLRIAAWARMQLESWSSHERRRVVDRLKREFQWAPVAEHFFAYLGPHVEYGRPVSRSCIVKSVQASLPKPAVTRLPKQKATFSERLTHLVLFGLMLFFVFLGVGFYRNANRSSRAEVPSKSPRLSRADTESLVKNMSAALLESVDVSPFELETRADASKLMFISHFLSQSTNADSRAIPEALKIARYYRWIYREQYLVRSYLAENDQSVDKETISFTDDGGWRVRKNVEAEEILLTFLHQSQRSRNAIEDLRRKGTSLNQEFWKSTALDLSVEEATTVLQGDFDKTFEIDKKLYPNPQEFELVRRLRRQNASLDRSQWRAYGHHQVSAENKP
ncbi:MAG: hypothetical protein JNL67_04285 [Planctomycetaceae bacterium]|nr:hypothetical protein [Planctomycetaceae bacterium]